MTCTPSRLRRQRGGAERVAAPSGRLARGVVAYELCTPIQGFDEFYSFCRACVRELPRDTAGPVDTNPTLSANSHFQRRVLAYLDERNPSVKPYRPNGLSDASTHGRRSCATDAATPTRAEGRPPATRHVVWAWPAQRSFAAIASTTFASIALRVPA